MPNPKITIEAVDLSKQKIIEPRLCEVELGEDRFIYRLKFKASEQHRNDDGSYDESLPWIEVDNDFNFVYKRSAFVGIEKFWVQFEKRWKIMISFDGVGSDLLLFFKKQKDCEAVFNQLVEYFYPLK
jgi:hypothetical protein